MPPADVLSRPSRRPDLVLSYGLGRDAVADVRIPAAGPEVKSSSAGPLPLVLFLHGGFWRAAYDRTHAGPLAEALADDGFVVCTPEFRKVGQAGGGWPGTFEDVATAVTVLPGLVAKGASGLADCSRLIIAGHSAGGHLALWAAAQLGAAAQQSQPGLEVISLAGVCDLAACYREGLGSNAAADLMGGGPDLFPGRYAAADPMNLTPLGAAISLVHGTADDRVPYAQSQEFGAKAQAAGDAVTCAVLPGCGHFEVIDPLSSAWPIVLHAFRAAASRLGRT